MSVGWRVELSTDWNVLGPFPIQAREQHYLSPAFPLVNREYSFPKAFSAGNPDIGANELVSEPIDFKKSWPSSYADNGHVFWSQASTDPDGTLSVSFPDIRHRISSARIAIQRSYFYWNRWKSLRATEGWAALQHHSLLHTTLKVYPPAEKEFPPVFRFNLIQGSFFTILPTDASRESYVPEWFSGNIYDLRDALPRAISLPSLPSEVEPTTYDIFVSGDYEIRLFGDPTIQGSDVPKLVIRLDVETESTEDPVVHEPSQDVLCDFVDGIPFGDVLGVGLRAKKGWWTVNGVTAINEKVNVVFKDQKYRIAPGQTRIIPLLADNSSWPESGFHGPELMLSLSLTSDTSENRVVLVRLPIRHVPHWKANPHQPIIGTYLYASSAPTAFAAVPPKQKPGPVPPILALHGAGVEALKDSFWVEALPRRQRNWYVVPQGRTSWGLDWHGPSARDAWAAVDALHEILNTEKQWYEWNIKKNARAIVMGHSNGGQGTWYITARYPDRVVAAIPAAAYIKSQAYIPLHLSRAGHFIDPALRAILESSLTPDDNDLLLSNLQDIPILALHGGDDENVPVWHSRELVNLLDSQANRSAIVQFREDPGKPHFWPEVFLNDEVEGFLNKISLTSDVRNIPAEFVLTVADPNEFGTLNGFKIESLIVPGRLGRLHVTISDTGTTAVKTVNVLSFSVLPPRPSSYSEVTIDLNSFGTQLVDRMDRVYFTSCYHAGNKRWELSGTSSQNAIPQLSITASRVPHSHQAPSRLQSLLSSDGRIGLIISSEIWDRGLSAALRIAHDLFIYHKVDSYIIKEEEALKRLENQDFGGGNLVYIGQPSSDFARILLGQRQTSFSSEASKLFLDGRDLSDPTMSSIFLHPHPDVSRIGSSMLWVLAYNDLGLERGLRLFPLRTGVPAPSWVVTSELADRQGAGGIIGAGVWARDWQCGEAMCMQQY